jgi:hypothetical protein
MGAANRRIARRPQLIGSQHRDVVNKPFKERDAGVAFPRRICLRGR